MFAPGRGLCGPASMWKCYDVNMPSLIRRVLAIFLIVGIGVSPLYAATMKGMERTARASSMTGTTDDMPCHPAQSAIDKSSSDQSSSDKPASGKTCPCMVACVSLCFQGMPPVAGAIVVPATVKRRAAFQNFYQLASLAPSPPARPPRS
jgi:hypothetical protein